MFLFFFSGDPCSGPHLLGSRRPLLFGTRFRSTRFAQQNAPLLHMSYLEEGTVPRLPSCVQVPRKKINLLPGDVPKISTHFIYTSCSWHQSWYRWGKQRVPSWCKHCMQHCIARFGDVRQIASNNNTWGPTVVHRCYSACPFHKHLNNLVSKAPTDKPPCPVSSSFHLQNTEFVSIPIILHGGLAQGDGETGVSSPESLH